jgi:hypothetical protein
LTVKADQHAAGRQHESVHIDVARSTISPLDDNNIRHHHHHHRFYGFYVAEFSSRVTGAARARRGSRSRFQASEKTCRSVYQFRLSL